MFSRLWPFNALQILIIKKYLRYWQNKNTHLFLFHNPYTICHRSRRLKTIKSKYSLSQTSYQILLPQQSFPLAVLRFTASNPLPTCSTLYRDSTPIFASSPPFTILKRDLTNLRCLNSISLMLLSRCHFYSISYSDSSHEPIVYLWKASKFLSTSSSQEHVYLQALPLFQKTFNPILPFFFHVFPHRSTTGCKTFFSLCYCFQDVVASTFIWNYFLGQ